VKLAEVEAKEKRLFQFGEYQTAKANEPRLRAELKKIEASIVTANERIVKLTGQHDLAGKAKDAAEGSIRKQEDDFGKIIGNFNGCIFPEFSTKPRIAEGIPDDFDAAITLFIRQQEKQDKLCDDITNLLAQTEQWFGDEFRGVDENETIATLQAELEALVEKEDALARDWNAHIHGLKATFDLVLKNLGHVRSAATNLNRAFDKVQVSNLKAVKLEVVEQSDMVSWIKRLAEFEPGGLFESDPQQESAIANFRRRIQDNPVIRFTNLFTLAFTVTGADDQRHTAGAQWQVDGNGYNNSGQTVAAIAPGSHSVSFKSVSGYTTPTSFSVNIVANAQTTTNATYSAVAATTYTLTLNAASGQGSIIPSPIGSGGGNTFTYNSGSLVQLTATAATGYHFTNWTGDASGTVNPTTITLNGNKNVTANFATGDPNLGTISVTIQPAAAITAGAQWKFNSSGWTSSGGSYNTPLLGANQNYLQFSTVAGWITPSPFYVTVGGGQTTNVTVTYQQDMTPGLLTVTLSPPDAVPAFEIATTLGRDVAGGRTNVCADNAGWLAGTMVIAGSTTFTTLVE
jgi:uncharacterized repeat protein (TIGR02543 family)